MPQGMSLESTLKESTSGKLERVIEGFGRALILYSGGLDSSVVLATCVKVLGVDNVIAFLGMSPSVPEWDLRDAKKLVRKLGVRFIMAETNQMNNPAYVSNPPERCYFCKVEILKVALKLKEAFKLNAIVSGTNADDLNDWRPGLKAEEEVRVLRPLADAGLGKEEVKSLALKLGIKPKPPSPCLASRIPYGNPITVEKMKVVEEAEKILRRLGIKTVRVRHHGDIARIEVKPEDFGTVLSSRIAQELKNLGFKFVSLDLEGFRSGSLNLKSPS